MSFHGVDLYVPFDITFAAFIGPPLKTTVSDYLSLLRLSRKWKIIIRTVAYLYMKPGNCSCHKGGNACGKIKRHFKLSNL